jgi:hypothetical protein
MPKFKKPDLHTEYSFRLALFSNRVFNNHFRNLAEGCPSLSKVDQEIFNKLQDNEKKRMGNARLSFVSGTVGGVAVIGILVYITSPRSPLHIPESYYNFISFLIPIVMISIEVCYLIPFRRRYSELLAIRRLFMVIRNLEKNRNFWDDSAFRKRIAEGIDRVAVAVERIPLAYGRIAPEVRRELFIASRSKAQAIRHLELYVIMTDSTGFTDLIDRLISDLCLLAKGRWYHLPEGENHISMSRTLIVIHIVGVVLLGGGVITIVVFAQELGVVAPILVTILSAVALALLNRIGLPVTTIQKYTDAASKITSTTSTPSSMKQ